MLTYLKFCDLDKKIARGQKNDFFRIFLFCCTSTHLDATFYSHQNFISSAVQRNHEGQRIRKFSAKMTPQAKKMTFFRIFFLSCTSTHQGATFLFLSKFHIFSRSEKSWGDKEKSVTSTNEQRRRTNERRTTNYIDDHNTSSGFSESSG